MPRIVIAHHLIFTGYGMWLPNDPRGSGSEETRKPTLESLGPIHLGRKPVQPQRFEVKRFYNQANPHLVFPPLWFDEALRNVIADAFARTLAQRKYTIWACAICSNHAHLLVRRHRDDGRSIWTTMAESAANAMRELPSIDPSHPIWADRPYDVFKDSPEQVRSAIAYINKNPIKEGLPEQRWPFVTPYDNWPLR